jgi:hypothetical protein
MRAYKYKHNLKGGEIAEKMLLVMETVVMYITMANIGYMGEMQYILLLEPLHYPHCVTDWIGGTLDHGTEILKFVSSACNMATYL